LGPNQHKKGFFEIDNGIMVNVQGKVTNKHKLEGLGRNWSWWDFALASSYG